jgi:hypothetical protein
MGVEHFAAHCAVCHGAPPSRDLRNHLSDAPIEYIMAAAERTSDGRRAGGLRSRIYRGYKAFHCGNHDPRIAIFILYP